VLLLLRPVLFAFMRSTSVKRLIVDLLKAYSKTTDNQIDDQIALAVERALGVGDPIK